MGPSQCSSYATETARDVGRLIARQGGILVCGGGGGVMRAAAMGAKEAGGVTVGILPGSRASDANEFIDIPIVTGLGEARNAVNVLTSEAIIAVCGAYGTLSEIALALKAGTPVVALDTWTVIPPADAPPPEIITARNPDEAVSAAFAAVRNRQRVG